MSFSFDTYENFARQFCNSNDETELRNSVSRGYYSFYHKVKKLLSLLDSEYFNHEQLITILDKDERLEQGSYLSSVMRTMKEERTQADYYKVNNPKLESIEFNKTRVGYFWQRYDMAVSKLKAEEENIV